MGSGDTAGYRNAVGEQALERTTAMSPSAAPATDRCPCLRVGASTGDRPRRCHSSSILATVLDHPSQATCAGRKWLPFARALNRVPVGGGPGR
jgi:hypothetical protein